MESSPSRPAREPWLVLGVGVVATVVYFWQAVTSPLNFLDRDMRRVYVPLKQFLAERLRSGHLPDWYPHDGLGQPFVGMMVSGALHPVNALYLFLPLMTALKLNVLICFPAAFLGTWLLARRFSLSAESALLAATVFSFNGYQVLLTNNLAYLMAAATVPWSLWAADRLFCRPSLLRAALAAALFTLVLFAGDPESFFFCGTLLVALLALRLERPRRVEQLSAFAGLAVLTLIFSTPQLVAAQGVTSQGLAGRRTLELATRWSLHPLQLIEIWIGPIFGGFPGRADTNAINHRLLAMGTDDVWSYSYHLGAPVIALALFALWIHRKDWRAWGLAALSAVFLLLMLGSHGGLYAIFFKVIPPFRAFRFPVKIAPFLALTVGLGAGFGLEAALTRSQGSRARWALAAVGLATALAFALEWFASPFGHFVGSRLGTDPVSLAAVDRLHASFLAGTLYTTLATGLCAALLWRPPRARVAALLTLVVFVYLIACNRGLIALTSPEFVDEPNGFVTTLRDDLKGEPLEGVRVFSTEGALRKPEIEGATRADVDAMSSSFHFVPDQPALFGLSSFSPYLPAANWRIASLRGPVNPVALASIVPRFGVRYIVANDEEAAKIDPSKTQILNEQRNFRLVLLRAPDAQPLGYLAEPHCVKDALEARRALLSHADGPRAAVVECDRPLPAPGAGPLGSVRTTRQSPERLQFEAEVQEPAVLVVNEALYSGWTARVDGVTTPILAANFLVQGVPLPPGHHQIELTYRTPWLVPSLWLSALAFLIAITFGAGLEWRRPTHTSSMPGPASPSSG